MAYIHGTDSDEQRRLAALNRLINPPFLKFLELTSPGDILEVGSGLGILTREVADKWPGAKVVGLEHSPDQLRAALADPLPSNLRLIEGDAQTLPFEDGRFDAVYCRFVLEHVPRPQTVCSEMFRVLRPGGRVFLQENDNLLQRFDPPTPRFDRVWRSIVVLQERLEGDALIGSKLFRLLHGAGFTEIALSFAPEAYRAGEAGLGIWIDNLSAIVRGCAHELAARSLATPDEIAECLSELRSLNDRPDASSWFAWNRASGIRPSG